MTTRQVEVLRYIVDAHEGGWTPTIRCICGEFGWSSSNAAHQHVRALATRGLVEQRGNQHPIRPTLLGLRIYGQQKKKTR